MEAVSVRVDPTDKKTRPLVEFIQSCHDCSLIIDLWNYQANVCITIYFSTCIFSSFKKKKSKIIIFLVLYLFNFLSIFFFIIIQSSIQNLECLVPDIVSLFIRLCTTPILRAFGQQLVQAISFLLLLIYDI